MIDFLLILAAAILAGLNLTRQFAVWWQVPVATLLVCLALLVGDVSLALD